MKSHSHSNQSESTSALACVRPTAAAACLLFAGSIACLAQDTPILPLVRASITDAASAPAALASVTRIASDPKTLHVIVGHSIFIDTKSRLHRVYVADPAVLNSVTLTPTEIIVTAMSPGISSLTLLDEAGHAQSYVVSSDIDIEGLRGAMAKQMRGDSVRIEGSGARVTLSGIVATDAISDSAYKLASLYSKEVANALTVTPGHPKQVRLQVRILEVDRSKALQLGINLFNPGGNTSFLAGSTTSQYPSVMGYASSAAGNVGGGIITTSNPLNFMLYSAKLNLGTTIQDLESKQVLQVLAEPTITTISGEKADFLSGGEFPFPMVQPGSGANTAPVVTISFRPYGVKVEFTPVVNEDGTIRLKVAPEVSALDYTNSVTISGFTVPALSTRRASTEVELRSNQSFAISGLLDQRTTDIMNKNPGAANIPILGYLFKSKNAVRSTTELVIVVTPTVVDPLVEMDVPSQPDLPVAPLNLPKYDQNLGRTHTSKPTAPPITPDHAPSIPPVFPNPASPKAAAAVSALQGSAIVPTAALPSTPIPPTALTFTAPLQVPAPTSSVPAVRAAADQPSLKPSIVEVMSVSQQSEAEVMVAALNRRGYNVLVTRNTENSLLHLDIGPFAYLKDAEAMRQRLFVDGYDPIIK